jgi:hypothetical protein
MKYIKSFTGTRRLGSMGSTTNNGKNHVLPIDSGTPTEPKCRTMHYVYCLLLLKFVLNRSLGSRISDKIIVSSSPRFLCCPTAFLFDLLEPWDVRALSIRKTADLSLQLWVGTFPRFVAIRFYFLSETLI